MGKCVHAWRRGFACKGTAGVSSIFETLRLAGLFVRGLLFSGKKKRAEMVSYRKRRIVVEYFAIRRKGGNKEVIFRLELE